MNLFPCILRARNAMPSAPLSGSSSVRRSHAKTASTTSDARTIRPATLLLPLVGGLFLTGCGEELSQLRTPAVPQALTYSYPLDGQSAVPTSAPILLRFSQPLAGEAEDLAKQLALMGPGGEITLNGIRLTEDQQGLVLQPASALAHSATYTLKTDGEDLVLPGNIDFSTAPATDGPLLEQTEGIGSFRVIRRIPDGSASYPATDMTVFRLQTSEPVDPVTVRYGETLSLIRSNGDLVNAQVLVQDHRITIDPLDPLTPGEVYQLAITDGIHSRIADTPMEVPTEPWQYLATDTHPRGLMAQRTRDSNGGRLVSKLTGASLNSVGLQSLLLGNENSTEASGLVFAELGYLPRFDGTDQSIPLRIARNSLMQGSQLDVVVAGALPAGFGSGDIDIRFLSAASGFLHPNPYTNLDSAPRIVELYLDLALSTDNPIANGAFAQQLLHVHLVGTAFVENGVMAIDAAGVIEPNVLGLDTASGLITFRLEGRADNDSQLNPDDFADRVAPEVKHWVPGAGGENTLQPGDPLVVFFTEPMMLTSLQAPGHVTLVSDGGSPGTLTAIETTLVPNGSALKIVPHTPLLSNVEYTLELQNLTDLAGNALVPRSYSFSLPDTTTTAPTDQAPLVLTSLPGYPCAKTGANLPSHQGRCSGGKSSDDALPVPSYPGDQSLLVRFSQDMDESSFIAGQTVRVQHQQNGVWQDVDRADYVLQTDTRELQIVPVMGWQNGQLYRYMLSSNYSNSGPLIRSHAGLPLQTQVLTSGVRDINDRAYGGPELVNYFMAAKPEGHLPLPLRNLPTADVNSDLRFVQGTEPGSQSGESMPNAAGLTVTGVSPLNTDTVVTAGRVGCRTDSSCPAGQYIYLTAGLDTRIYPQPNAQGELEVDIFPSFLATSSNDLWVRIDTSFIDAFPDFILSVDLSEHERIPTGPMFMRIRYADDGAGNDVPPKGAIYNDDNGQLSFRTTLDVYLDAPYLNPSLGPAVLNHNLRSYPINNLTISGPITFLDDGRMQIALSNESPITINADVEGTIEITGSNTGGLCGLWPFTYICGGIANVAVDADSRLQLQIPPGKLRLNYLSPITQ
ncbi:Ig-like domain-containing protein [Marinobacter mobilis]|uniref:Ig-like domain-containing protein n=1 Tax=Marinobacter mobilis TaxID=488533 RepID=UPI0035C7773B